MDNNDIKVSVIIPIYNAYDYLRPAMDSVLDQTLRDIEIICIDDGSTDKSLEILKEYQKSDDRVRIITETNAGPALARNKGISRARGEYVAFLDADDFFEPILLESLYSAAKRDDLDIVISEYDVYNSNTANFEDAPPVEHADIYTPGAVTSKNEHPDDIFTSTTGSAWNKLYRRSFIIDKGLSFLPDVKMYEDVYFVVTSLSLAERVGKVFDVLMHHRVHYSQLRARAFRKYHAQIPFVYSKIKEFLMAHGMYAPLRRSYLNMTASRCYKTYNMLPKDAKEDFWNLLYDEYAEKLGWRNYTRDDFELEEVCEFVACIELYNHDAYKKAMASSNSPRFDRLAQRIKSANLRKKWKAFFSKLFGKKNK